MLSMTPLHPATDELLVLGLVTGGTDNLWPTAASKHILSLVKQVRWVRGLLSLKHDVKPQHCFTNNM